MYGIAFQFKVCGLGEMTQWLRILLLQRNQVQWSQLAESPDAGSFVLVAVFSLNTFTPSGTVRCSRRTLQTSCSGLRPALVSGHFCKDCSVVFVLCFEGVILTVPTTFIWK